MHREKGLAACEREKRKSLGRRREKERQLVDKRNEDQYFVGSRAGEREESPPTPRRQQRGRAARKDKNKTREERPVVWVGHSNSNNRRRGMKIDRLCVESSKLCVQYLLG